MCQDPHMGVADDPELRAPSSGTDAGQAGCQLDDSLLYCDQIHSSCNFGTFWFCGILCHGLNDSNSIPQKSVCIRCRTNTPLKQTDKFMCCSTVLVRNGSAMESSSKVCGRRPDLPTASSPSISPDSPCSSSERQCS